MQFYTPYTTASFVSDDVPILNIINRPNYGNTWRHKILTTTDSKHQTSGLHWSLNER